MIIINILYNNYIVVFEMRNMLTEEIIYCNI